MGWTLDLCEVRDHANNYLLEIVWDTQNRSSRASYPEARCPQHEAADVGRYFMREWNPEGAPSDMGVDGGRGRVGGLLDSRIRVIY